jgi:hypothetical protein
MDIPAIASEIRRLHSRSNEGEVNGVWNSILNWVFDPVNGFITQPQAMHTSTGGARGFSDFNTLEVAGGTRRSFLITQCKSSLGEGQREVWLDGAVQLLRYLRAQHRGRRGSQRVLPMASSPSEEGCASSNMIGRRTNSGVGARAAQFPTATVIEISIFLGERLPRFRWP